MKTLFFTTSRESPDQEYFEINQRTGSHLSGEAPDYENPKDADANNTYEVLVVATDGELEDEQLLRVKVLDVDELVPPG